MDDNKRALVDFPELGDRPSIKFAKYHLADILSDYSSENIKFEDPSDKYDDVGYSPTYSEIQEWALESARQMDATMMPFLESFADGVGDKDSEFHDKYTSALSAFSKCEIDEIELVSSIADLFSWMDHLPMLGCTPFDDYWHSTKVCSTIVHIGNNSVQIIDTLYDLLQEVIDKKMLLEVDSCLKAGHTPNADDLEKYSAERLAEIKKATIAINDLISFSTKAGFLYRDAWWLENHGEAAADYYRHASDWKQVQEARKEGAQATQNKAQKQKIAARELVREAVRIRGMLFVTASEKHKAETIQKLATGTSQKDFEFQKGKMRPFSWFLEQIEEMVAQGEFAAIATEELQKT